MARWKININGDEAATYAAALTQIAKAREELLAALARFPHHGRNYQTNRDPAGDLRADTVALGQVFRGLGDLERWEEKQIENLHSQERVDSASPLLYLVQ